MTHLLESSVAVDEPFALVRGRAAMVLAAVLRGSLRGGLSLPRLLADMRLTPDDQAAAQAGFEALEVAGHRWHDRRRADAEIRGNAATRGNEVVLVSPVMVNTADTADLLGRTERRVRQLALSGELAGARTSRGWVFLRDDVVEYRERTNGGAT